MDYTTKPRLFQIQKFLRYCQLYGFQKTLVKVRGQYHMKKAFQTLPVITHPERKGGSVALIGCGNFQYSHIAYYLHKYHRGCMRAAMDININRAASIYNDYNLHYYTDSVDKIMADDEVKLVYIASNHASHADYAVRALDAGKDVHIEKPHCVTLDQLNRLVLSMSKSSGRVLSIGYNRPVGVIGAKILEALRNESGAAMINWFVAGHQINPDHWYYHSEEGGRILGNMCHWIHFSMEMIDTDHRFPITITPTRTEKSDSDVVVTFTYGDNSIALISFSAQGHTFEGVRERFSAQKGNTLIKMDDFQETRIDVVQNIRKIKLRRRDHGHLNSICGSYLSSLDREEKGLTSEYIRDLGNLILGTKEALDNNKKVRIDNSGIHFIE